MMVSMAFALFSAAADHHPRPLPHCGGDGLAECPNFLFIVSDDLRPQIDAVGFDFPQVHTPHLRALSERALSFTRAYVQQALCGPSRNSFLSGRRPDSTMSWNFIDSFRTAPGAARWKSLPQWFREAGWNTLGAGKIFHPGLPQTKAGAPWDYPYSWDNLVANITEQEHRNGSLVNRTYTGYEWLYPSEKRCPGNTSWCAIDPAADAANADFEDGQITNATLPLLRAAAANRSASGRPWFVAAGFRKPHLQWKFPAAFLNASFPPPDPNCPTDAECLAASIPLPKHRRYPPDAPLVGFHQPNDDFNLAFDDTVACGGASMGPFWNFNDTCTRQFRRAYVCSLLVTY